MKFLPIAVRKSEMSSLGTWELLCIKAMMMTNMKISSQSFENKLLSIGFIS